MSAIISFAKKVFFSVVILTLATSYAQQSPTLQVSSQSFIQIKRILTPVPKGRVKSLKDVYIRHFVNNSTRTQLYRFKNINKLLTSPDFDFKKPTAIYCHGWVEHVSDKNIQDLMGAYTRNGRYNALLLDWSNYAFGGYISASFSLNSLATGTANAIMNLLKGGMSLETLHLVGHSLGAELLAQTCRDLTAKGIRIRRLTCLDAAFPGFYPPILGKPVTPSVAEFVDAIHTDGGMYGTPAPIGHADFWPNEGKAKQPGCPTITIPVTSEDLCSHWRSHNFWAESLLDGRFLARQCMDYDRFLRGDCSGNTMVPMGVEATPDLRGNFYLRTAARPPFALGEKGAA